MDFNNEFCPVCSKQFNSSDDIVVCPVCGTPHHRACYESAGHCINEEKHAEGYEWRHTGTDEAYVPSFNRINRPPVTSDKTVCPVCGRENPSEEPVCLNCGARLYNGSAAPQNMQGAPFTPFGPEPQGMPNVVSILPTDTVGGHSVADTAEFIQQNSQTYIPKFFRMERTGSRFSMNWAAFIFGAYWFLYRKMAMVGVILMLISTIVPIACTTTRVQDVVNEYMEVVMSTELSQSEKQELTQQASEKLMGFGETYILLGFYAVYHILCGLFADPLYKSKVQKDIGDIKKESLSTEDYKRKLFTKGGVSILYICLAAVGSTLLSELLSYLVTRL